MRETLLRWFSVWGRLARAKPDAVAAAAEGRRLTLKKSKNLFRAGEVLAERQPGLPKSYLAFKLPLPA